MDYAAEADIEDGDDDTQGKRSSCNASEVYSARQYDYSTEKQCDKNAEIFAEAIQAVHNVSPDGFAAIKITALCNPTLLERWSTSLVEIRRLFERLDRDDDKVLSYAEFFRGCKKYFNADENEIRTCS